MGWESFDVVRFYLGPLLQGETRIAKVKSAYNSLIIGPGFLLSFRWIQICIGSSMRRSSSVWNVPNFLEHHYRIKRFPV